MRTLVYFCYLLLATLPALAWWRWGWRISLILIAVEIAALVIMGVVLSEQPNRGPCNSGIAEIYFLVYPAIAIINGIALTTILAIWQHLRWGWPISLILAIATCGAIYAVYSLLNTPGTLGNYLLLLFLPGPAIVIGMVLTAALAIRQRVPQGNPIG
jgi:hypothetical protein